MSGETSENRPRYCVGRALDLWPSLSISAGSISAGDLPADTHEKKNNREIYTPHKHRGISRQHCIEVVQDEYNDGYTQLYIQALNGRLEERKKEKKGKKSLPTKRPERPRPLPGLGERHPSGFDWNG